MEDSHLGQEDRQKQNIFINWNKHSWAPEGWRTVTSQEDSQKDSYAPREWSIVTLAWRTGKNKICLYTLE
jgi:hypothetical protein